MREAHLAPGRTSRPLPRHLLGFNTPVPYDIPHEDPRFPALLRDLRPGLLRFPGGTVANFWDWRSGHLVVPEVEGGSMYRRFLVSMQEYTRRLHPDGCSMTRFVEIAREAGAETVIVPNLETSTPEEQAAWFRRLQEQGIVPRRVEMGNEFYLALLGDPESERRFPDWKTTLDLTREFVDAISPYLPGDAKIAVQSAGSRWRGPADTGDGLHHKEWLWDEAMSPEPWFHAATVHPYPEIQIVAGRDARDGLPGNIRDVASALLAKVDEGTKRTLQFVESKLPGKEIWVTEWGAGEIGAVLRGETPVFNAMWLQVVARYMLSILRHGSVTAANYHGAFFDGGVWSVYRRDGQGGYVPVGPWTLLRWFHEAANGGVRYRRVAVEGARRIEGGGLVPDEGYLDVEGALLEGARAKTALLQNVSDGAVRLDVSGVADGAAPEFGEVLVTPDLTEGYERRTPPPVPLEVDRTVELPAWSIVRLVWR